MPDRPHAPLRRARATMAAVVGSALLIVPGCSLLGDDDAAPRTTGTTEATTTSTTAPALQVLDPGAEPRRALRLGFSPGLGATLALTADLTVSQETDGSSAPVTFDAPAVTQTVRLGVTRVQGDQADIELEIIDAAADRAGTSLTDQEFVALTAQVQQLVGLHGTGRMTDQGRLVSLHYTRPDDLDPAVAATLDDLEGQLDDLAVPLPDEPVGVGARWRARSRTTSSGVTVERVTTYQLTGIDGDVLTYRATVAQTGRPQELDLAGLPSGTTARLVSSRTTGTTAGTMDLGSLAATSTSTLTGTQVVALTPAAGATTRLSQHLDVRTAVRPTG